MTGFQIQMFKNVRDSGWVEVGDLAVIVGKNEAGKTSILRALHKFNPATDTPYNIKKEWPRGLRARRSSDQPVATVEFELSEDEQSELAALSKQALSLAKIRVSKSYSGEFFVHFPDEPFPKALDPNEVADLCKSLPAVPDGLADQIGEATEKARSALDRLAREGRFSEVSSKWAELAPSLTAASANNGPAQKFVQQFQRAVEVMMNRANSLQTVHEKAHDFIVSRLPTFVYMDEYRTFTGTALLSQVKAREKSPTAADETFRTILKLAELELDELLALAKDREERQYEVSDGEATLTAKVAKHWRQRQYNIRFRVDEDEFFTFVADASDPALIPLEERSQGFRWFFSFDLLLMHETKGRLKDCVILLDEPGMHLHPGGQKDLLSRLENYAEGNVLIYTTHLPFMLDLRHPERIKVLKESEDGAVVTDNLNEADEDGKLTLQSALGIGAESSWLVAERNLVVEGAHDYWLLSALSEFFVRVGRDGLPDDVMITAAGGASKMPYLATFMIGQGLQVVALFDSDASGKAASKQFVTSWLERYKGKKGKALSLGSASGARDNEFAIEDLFPEETYLGFVEEVYAGDLKRHGIHSIDLEPKEERIDVRLTRWFSEKGLRFNKGTVAKTIRRKISRMSAEDDLAKPLLERAEMLFRSIREAFASLA